MAARVLGPERLRNGRTLGSRYRFDVQSQPVDRRDTDALTDPQIGISYGVPNLATDEDLALRCEWCVNNAGLSDQSFLSRGDLVTPGTNGNGHEETGDDCRVER